MSTPEDLRAIIAFDESTGQRLFDRELRVLSDAAATIEQLQSESERLKALFKDARYFMQSGIVAEMVRCGIKIPPELKASIEAHAAAIQQAEGKVDE